ncbi:MAG: gamma-glutamyltransferase [Deltaproteobacteria bacterium]|nr:MAG: gamma-glutamyltransferase [Deltaproteobacteria bacterium]
MLEAGGNAFDAVVAASWAACVAEPVLASLGGAGFLMARQGSGQATLFDCGAQTPLVRRAAGETEFMPVTVEFGTASQQFHVGLGSVATPGLVQGLFHIHRELCSLPMTQLVEPAVRWARRGLEVLPLQAYLFNLVAPIFTFSAEARRVYGSPTVAGKPVQAGERLILPELADSIEALAREGAELFYRGDMGRALVAAGTGGGGHLTLDDLEAYQVEPREPLRLAYRDAELWLNPPPSSGGILVAFGLKLLEACELSQLDWAGEQFQTLLARILEQTGLARAAGYDGREQEPEVVEAFLADANLAGYLSDLAHQFPQTSGTTHISVGDRDGNVASLTITNGEGCGYVAPGVGVMLNNMLGEQDVHPQGFHCWEPNTRISSMMAPAVATRGGTTIAVGSGGSNRIRTCLLQVLVKLIDFGLSGDQAVNSSRIHMEDGLLSIEGGFAPQTVAALREAFTEVELWPERNLFFGGAHVVIHDRQRGEFEGAGDERRGGVALIVD